MPIHGLKEEVTMEIRIQSLKFNADQKLLDYVEKKVSKIERFDDNITSVEVVLSLEERPENKAVKLQVAVPSDTLVVDRSAKTFEEAVTEAVDIMKERLVRNLAPRHTFTISRSRTAPVFSCPPPLPERPEIPIFDKL